MTILLIITAFTLCLIIFGVIEYKQHQNYLNAIFLRIHVNETRGKLSVNWFIEFELRISVFKVITKRTDTFPGNEFE